MPNRKKTHETVRLILEILHRIPRGRYVTAKDLHKQIAADTTGIVPRELRTIQRLLQRIVDYYPAIVVNEESKPYGYQWNKHAPTFSIPSLNEQEALLLLLTQKHLGALLPVSVMKSMHGFFEQAHRTLSAADEKSKGRLAREWLGKVRIVSKAQPLLPAAIKDGVLEAVTGALYANHWLRLDYVNAKGQRMKKEVMPLGLAQMDSNCYLACRFEKFDDDRTVALHRMISATDTGARFTRPKFDLQQYDDDGHFAFGEGERVRLSFSIDEHRGRHLLETKLSADQTAVKSRGKLKITATVTDSARLDWWLKSFGDDIGNIKRSPL